eukprot:11108947-Alexandrium_andersonii.AAC.1
MPPKRGKTGLSANAPAPAQAAAPKEAAPTSTAPPMKRARKDMPGFKKVALQSARHRQEGP